MVKRSIIILLCIMASGCGEESTFEPQDSVPEVPTDSLTALQFPTADGCYWEYVSYD